jgi:hypothetical protein
MADKHDDTAGDRGLFASTFGCCAPTLRQNTDFDKERGIEGNSPSLFLCFDFVLDSSVLRDSGLLVAALSVLLDSILSYPGSTVNTSGMLMASQPSSPWNPLNHNCFMASFIAGQSVSRTHSFCCSGLGLACTTW